MNVNVIPLVDEGLGNSAYLLDLGDGRALAVDATRDLRALRVTAERLGLKVAFAADTHLHADFLSGAVQLAATDGATVLASGAGHREFPHRGLTDGDEVDLGGLVLRTLATPGHTHEHIAFEIVDDARVLGVFTGGSLIVGSAARTDLVSPERTEELARAQYRSLQRLAELDDDVAVWPTHGAGSFCSAPPGVERTSTIGAERASNALLRAGSEDAFVQELLGSLGTFPPYFLRLGELNRRGPALVEGDVLPPLSAEQVARLRAGGAELVDVRPVPDFAAGHLPGSVSIPLRPAFATWLGWLVDDDGPWSSCATPTRTRPRSSGRPARSATTGSPASWTAVSSRGPLPGSRRAPSRWSTPQAWRALTSSTSARRASTPPATSRVPCTSSSARSPRQCRRRRRDRPS